jgi:hypothetical protein
MKYFVSASNYMPFENFNGYFLCHINEPQFEQGMGYEEL